MTPALLLSAVLSTSPADAPDLVETAAAAGGFQTLLTAAEKAGLVGALKGADALTVLAPTDAAFAEVPEDLLQDLLLPRNREALAQVLKYHVIPGTWSATGLLSGRAVATLEGSQVRFALQDGQLRANEARLVKNDLAAANGVIHVIDRVLIPADFVAPRSAPTAAGLIERAVEAGAPLYNRGQVAACAAVYQITAEALLLLDEEQIGEASMGVLRRTLAQAADDRHAMNRAWTLRRGLDEVWRTLQQQPSPAVTVEESDPMRTLFDFSPEEGRWSSVNDDVMGGVSQGGFEQVSDSVAAFRGALSLENNGGFSTMRSAARDLELGSYDGLVLRVRGDGRTYGISGMTSDRRWETRTFRTSFATKAGEWQEVRVPFADMKLSIMGRRFDQTVDPSAIRSLGFSISDKDETPFRLEIDWIRAWRADA